MKNALLTIFFSVVLVFTAWGQCAPYSVQINILNAQSSGDTIFLCRGDSAQAWASVTPSSVLADTLQFEWTWGQGSLTVGDTGIFTFNDPGIFTANLAATSSADCTPSNTPTFYVIVSDSSWFAQTDLTDTVCLNSEVLLLPKPRFDTLSEKCAVTPPDTLFLPDGTGVSYYSPIVVNCYDPNDVITSASFIESICLDIEHSFAGDLVIELQAPNGASFIVQEPPSYYDLGEPIPSDNSNPVAGTPYTYCFLENNSTYGLMNSADVVSVSYVNVLGNNVTASVFPGGTYDTEESFSGVVGSPINGTWTLIVTDELGLDNGFLFSWSLNFNTQLVTTQSKFAPYVVQATWTTTSGSFATQGDTSALWQPSDTGWASIDYHYTDVFGCTGDTVFDIYVRDIPQPVASHDTICYDGILPNLVNSGSGATQWYYPNTSTLYATGNSVLAPFNLSTGTNEIYLRSALEGCVVWDTATIYRRPQLSATIFNPTVTLGNTPHLSATVSGGSGNYAYQWEPALLMTTPQQSSTDLTFAIQNDVLAQLTVTDQVTGCSRTFSFTIDIQSPLSVSAGSNKHVCLGDSIFLNGTIVTQTDPVDSVRWTGTGLDTTANGFWYTPSQSGSFQFTGYSNGAVDVDALNVSVSLPPTAGSDIADSICPGEVRVLNSYLNGSQSTGGIWVDDQGNTVDTAFNSGNYWYIVTQSPCDPDSAQLVLTTSTDPGLSWGSIPDTLCANDLPFDFSIYAPQGVNFLAPLSPTGILNNGVTGSITARFGYSFGPSCSATAAANIYIAPNDSIFVPDTTTYCAGPDTVLLSGFYPSTAQVVSSPGQGDSIFLSNLSPGLYSYTVLSSSSLCGTVDTGYIRINTGPLPTWSSAPTFCEYDAPYNLNLATPVGGIYSGPGVTGNTFDPQAAGPGSHNIRYEVIQNGCLSIDSITIDVAAVPTITINLNTDTVCISDPVELLQAQPAGGVWQGPGVSASNFDPDGAGVGSHWLTYTFQDTLTGCSSTDSTSISVFDDPQVGFSVPDTLCASDLPIFLNPMPVGGVFNGAGVAADSLDPSGLSGWQPITYTYTNDAGCTDSLTRHVYVDQGPAFTVTPLPDFCSSDAPDSLSAVQPLGGQYSGAGIVQNIFDPATAGPGTHVLTYTYTNSSGCLDSVSLSCTVWAEPNAPALGIPDSVCVTDQSTFSLSDSTAQLFLNGSSVDSVVPSSLIPGAHQWTSISTQGACVDSLQGTFYVIDVPTVSVTAPADVCEHDGVTPLPVGNPAAGSYYGPGIANGLFDPALAGPGTHTFYYAVSNALGCADSASFTWTVHAKPQLTITPPPAMCPNDGLLLLNQISPTGGVYSGPGVVTANGFPHFNPSAVAPGIQVIQYEYSDANGCDVDTVMSLVVNDVPAVSLGPLPNACENDSAFLLTGGSPLGGWYAGIGVSGDTLNHSGAGAYLIQYYYQDSLGCTGQATEFQIVNVAPPIPQIDQYNYTLICNWGFYQYQWLWNGDTIPGATSISHTPTQPGDYTVIITNTYGCSSYSAPYTMNTVSVQTPLAERWRIFPNPSARTLRVDGQSAVSSWQVVDLSGRTVISGDNRLPELIEVAEWSNGKYFLRITTDQNSVVLPFVVQH